MLPAGDLSLSRLLGRRLAGRVVVVTGASAGIGHDTALRLAAHGAHVVAAARDADRLGALAAAAAGTAGSVTPAPTDVTAPGQRRALIDTALAVHGRLDALVNNAGVGFDGLLEDMTGADLQRLADTNMVAVADLTRLALPALAARGGHVVLVSSVAGWVAFPPLGYYAATKFFVDGLTMALRRELWSRGVLVHSVNPGPVRTEFGSRAQTGHGHTGPERRDTPGVPAWWVAAAVEGCLLRPWPRTAAVPRVLGLARLAGLPGVRTALDVATSLPVARRGRPSAVPEEPSADAPGGPADPAA